MNTLANFKPSGWITVIKLKETGKEVLIDKKNSILADAKQIMAKCLGGNDNYLPTHINVYSPGTILIASVVCTPSFPSSNVVKYTAIFDEASFDGDFNEAFLSASGVSLDFADSGVFATQNKSATERIAITWEITIN